MTSSSGSQPASSKFKFITVEPYPIVVGAERREAFARLLEREMRGCFEDMARAFERQLYGGEMFWPVTPSGITTCIAGDLGGFDKWLRL